MWNEIKQLALELLHEDARYENETEGSLLDWVLATGYAAAQRSHERTEDLVYVYAASLRNSGAPGPGFEAFAEMVAAAVRPSITDNVIGQPDLCTLAERCDRYLDTPGASKLALRGTVDYREQLRRLADGQRVDGILPRSLDSVVRFIDFLRRSYGGSAPTYHQDFAAARVPGAPKAFVVEKFNEIADLPQVGVAVAMNFFKDSQVPGFAQRRLNDTNACNVGWFVKPDKHVLRLMLCATGRMAQADIEPTELYRLADREALRAFDTFESTLHPNVPYQLLPGAPGSQMGQWKCIEEIHRIAAQEGVPPLGYDRLLYLIGSGRYKHPSKPLVTSRSDRYRRYVRAIHGGVEAGGRAREIPPALPRRLTEPRPEPGAQVQDEPVRPAPDLFLESIEASEAAIDLVDELIAQCEVAQVRVHYTHTNGGDLRVQADRARPQPREQNVITMRWVPSKNRFTCQSLIPAAACIALGIPADLVKPNHGPLPTTLQVRPGVDDEAFLLITNQSIAQFRAQ